jgi:hypothetical protein
MEAPVPQYLRDHARHLQKHPTTIASATMRYHSQAGLELLAAMATGGSMGYAALLSRLREMVVSGATTTGLELDGVAVAALARAKARWPGPGLDYTESADLHQATRLLLSDGRSRVGLGLPRYLDRLDAQTNLAVGRIDYVSTILPKIRLDDESRWTLETELEHPQLGRSGSTIEGWLRAFNRLFEDRGLMPITLREGDGTPFDRLEPATTPVVSSTPGPTVSIVMSVFKPDASLVTSLRSLLSQTWPHLQVLVVDDCSPDEYQPLIAEAVALDDRIELHRMPVNGGTYKIRNFALARARGEFVAFQDSDDWSHPERIERQLRPLLDDSRLMASLSRAVRLDAWLSQNRVGYGSLRQNASSLMFRREPVLTALGGYDEVRKAADSEFTSRLEVVFGTDSVRELELPLALVQLTSDSLSRLDFRFGWHDGNRVFYRQAYEYWHRRLAARGGEAKLVAGGPRPFPAPASFIGQQVDADRRCDVVIVSDWRRGISRYGGGSTEVRALLGAGHSVAVAHAETMRYSQRRRVSPSDETMRMWADSEAQLVRWEDPLLAATVFVRDPELLSYPRDLERNGIRAERVVVHAGYPCRAPDGGWLVYEPAVVEENAQALFGGELVWIPANEQVAASLRTEGAAASILEPRQLGIVPVRRRSFAGRRGGRPVIGTAGIVPHVNDRPSDAELLAMLPDDDRYDVRIRDVIDGLRLQRRPRLLPPNWLVTQMESVGRFVDQLDFFLGHPNRSWGPERPFEAATAMARGCVTILHPSYEAQFGAAALYTSSRSAIGIVDDLVRDPAAFAEQQRRGYEWCERELSVPTFLRSFADLTATPQLITEMSRS